MKGLFRNSLILTLFLSLVFSIAGVFAAWTYGGGTPTETADVDAGLEDFPYYNWVTSAPTSGKYVVYHSYSYDDQVDRVYRVEPYTEGGTVPVPDLPIVHRKIEDMFLGWSPLASHASTLKGDSDEYTDANFDGLNHTPKTYLPTKYPIPTEKKYTWDSTLNEGSGDYAESEGIVEYITHTDTIPVSEIIGYANASGIIDLYDLSTRYKLEFPLTVDVSMAGEGGGIRPISVNFYLLKPGSSLSDISVAPSEEVTIKSYLYNKIASSSLGSRPSGFVNRNLYFHPGIGMWMNSADWTGGSAGNYCENEVTLTGTGGGDGTYYKKTNFYMQKIGMVAPTISLKQVGYYEDGTPIKNEDGSTNMPGGSGGGGGCIASGTMITLADGSQIPIEELTAEHKLRVFNHETGKYVSANILFIEDDGYDYYNVINCEFSNGKRVKLIYEHGLFDLTTNRYEYITEENYAQFIGHEFAVESENGYGRTTLTKAYITNEYTGCYELPSEWHMNYFIDGMFSMPGGITGLFNFFEFDENLAYDEEKMEQDIALYGLFTYEEFKDYMSEELYNSIFPIKYLKISIGKGLVTMEGIEYIIERYIVRHGLDQIE